MARPGGDRHRRRHFSMARRGGVIPLEPGQTKIAIRLDNSIIEHFRRQVEDAGGGNCRTLINDALLAYIGQRSSQWRSSKVDPFGMDLAPVERRFSLFTREGLPTRAQLEESGP